MAIIRAAIGAAVGVEPTSQARPAAAGAPPQRQFVEVLGEASGASGPRGARTARPSDQKAAPLPETMGIRRTLEGLLAAERRIDALVNAAKGGRTFSAGELLVMQSTVFRYAQTVEIVSRAADRLVGAVKQTLSTQV